MDNQNQPMNQGQTPGVVPLVKPAPQSLAFAIVAVVVIVIVLAAAAWWFLSQSATLPSPSQMPSAPRVGQPGAVLPPSDSTASINQSLQNIDTGNLEQEFQNINNDLNSL